jgi:hypothetical protein
MLRSCATCERRWVDEESHVGFLRTIMADTTVEFAPYPYSQERAAGALRNREEGICKKLEEVGSTIS